MNKTLTNITPDPVAVRLQTEVHGWKFVVMNEDGSIRSLNDSGKASNAAFIQEGAAVTHALRSTGLLLIEGKVYKVAR